MSESISELSIRELLDGSKDRYMIPMYQRNYAWDEGEITQLIQDILDYLPQGDYKPRKYYIGSLVVFERGVAQSMYEFLSRTRVAHGTRPAISATCRAVRPVGVAPHRAPAGGRPDPAAAGRCRRRNRTGPCPR